MVKTIGTLPKTVCQQIAEAVRNWRERPAARGAIMAISGNRVGASAIPANSVAAEPATAALAPQFARARALCAERLLDAEESHCRQTL